MKKESEPVSADEWLIRRVHRDQFRLGEESIIAPRAFLPRKGGRDIDEDGISLYRAACLSDPAEVLATVPDEKRAVQGIVRIPMALLASLGLAVRPMPDERVKGHLVVPGLDAAALRADKARVEAVCELLAVEASKPENILRQPEPPEDALP